MSAEGADGNNIATPATNTTTLSNALRLVSKPGYISWRNMNESSCYTVCYNYDRSKESHLMKNSEWGAVAYLTHSQYGRNGNEMNINNSSEYKTGSSGNSPTAGADEETTNDYKSDQGTKASSTGNVYGIYDLSGGAWEYVAAYITNSKAQTNGQGKVFTRDKDGNLITESTEYATVYPYNTEEGKDTDTENYNEYKNQAENNTKRYGDAILETSTSGSGSTSWNNDYSSFPYASYPFFARGCSYGNRGNVGVFSFASGYGGTANSYSSFRACLCV